MNINIAYYGAKGGYLDIIKYAEGKTNKVDFKNIAYCASDSGHLNIIK